MQDAVSSQNPPIPPLVKGGKGGIWCYCNCNGCWMRWHGQVHLSVVGVDLFLAITDKPTAGGQASLSVPLVTRHFFLCLLHTPYCILPSVFLCPQAQRSSNLEPQTVVARTSSLVRGIAGSILLAHGQTSLSVPPVCPWSEVGFWMLSSVARTSSLVRGRDGSVPRNHGQTEFVRATVVRATCHS